MAAFSRKRCCIVVSWFNVLVMSGCFLPGTTVTLGTGDHQAIETLRIGQRVLTPESVSSVEAGVSVPGLESGPLSRLSGSETQVDPATWRSYKVSLRDALAESLELEVTLLRPVGWIAEHSRRVAGRQEVWVDFEELNAKGWAEVIEERACPVIEAGPGKVITATITRPNEDVRTLTMSSGETLHVTGNHRMYSATQRDWVPVKELRVGEELRTSSGRESVASLGFQRGRHQVYNLEVETEHCYFVGTGEVLSHNACPVTDTLNPSGGEDSIKPGDTRRYGDFQKFPGDNIEGHELLQNSKLKQAGALDLKGDNPSLALTQADHKKVSRAQAAAGLHNPAKIAGMSALQNVRENVRVTKNANVVSRSQLATTANAARKHAKKVRR